MENYCSMQANKDIYLPGDLLIEKFETHGIIIQISANDYYESGCDLIVRYTEILIRNYVGVTTDAKSFKRLWWKQ